MNVEVVRNDGNLKRERWGFSLYISSTNQLYFDYFVFETRDSLRYKIWHKQSTWFRLMTRDSTIGMPSVPEDIITEAKGKIISQILELPITS